MKKILFLFIIAVASISCTQDLHDNNPAFQAIHDNTLWKAGDASVQSDGAGGLIITAYRNYETLTFHLSDTTVGTYYFGTSSQSNYALYTNETDGSSVAYDTDIYAGPVYQINNIVTAGTNYIEGDIVLTEFSTSSPDNGSGLRLYLNSTSTVGGVTGIDIVSRGNGYYPGDIVTLVGGDSNATVQVLNTQNSNGELTLEATENGTFTGSFKVTATDGSGSITFTEGIFYNIPLR